MDWEIGHLTITISHHQVSSEPIIITISQVDGENLNKYLLVKYRGNIVIILLNNHPNLAAMYMYITRCLLQYTYCLC